MPDAEVTKLRGDLVWLLEHVVGCLEGLDPAELDRERATPGGPSNGRGVLLWAVSHAAQHYEAAQLTRDLVVARRGGPLAGP